MPAALRAFIDTTRANSTERTRCPSVHDRQNAGGANLLNDSAVPDQEVSPFLSIAFPVDVGESVDLDCDASGACSTSQLRNFRNDGFRSLFLG
jgi:hypothetical protein